MNTPAINVNLKPCQCAHRVLGGLHADGCPGIPILIPCPIPRSVTFTVRLGECATPHLCEAFKPSGHVLSCSARHIRVSCSITGKDWPSSEAADPEVYRDQNIGINVLPSDLPKLLTICRERWALVKALVLNMPSSAVRHHHEEWKRLLDQRDAVFAALADMARAEDGIITSWHTIPSDIRTPLLVIADEEDGARPSQVQLERYVAHIIEQVGALP